MLQNICIESSDSNPRDHTLPKICNNAEVIACQPHAWEFASQYCLDNGLKKIQVVSDPYLFQKYKGKLENVFSGKISFTDAAALKSSGAYDRQAYVCQNAEVLLALGGGTNIDQTKLLALENALEWIALPTSPTAAIASHVASIPNGASRSSIRTPAPKGIYIDSNLFSEIPEPLLKSVYGDSLSSISAVQDAYLAHLDHEVTVDLDLLSESYRLAESTLEMTNFTSEHEILSLFNTNIRFGQIMNTSQSSVLVSGTEHAISHSLDTLGSKRLHGIQVGFGTLVAVALQSTLKDLARELKNIGIQPPSTERLKMELSARAFPVHIDQLQLTAEEFRFVLQKSLSIRQSGQQRYGVLEKLGVEQSLNILKNEGICPR